MPPLKRQWTWDDLQELPEDGNRYEVIDGELFVTPSPAWRHQRAVGELFSLLRDYLSRERVGEVLISPADVMFSQRDAVQPDVFVVPFADGRLAETFADAYFGEADHSFRTKAIICFGPKRSVISVQADHRLRFMSSSG